MTVRRRTALTALAVGGALAGCAGIVPKPLETTLFPPPGAVLPPKDPAPIALSLADPAQTFTNPPVRMRFVRVELPIGRIVEAAALLALGEQFAAVGVGAADARVVPVRVADVAPELDSALVYLVPVPGGLIDRVDITTRLAFGCAALGPDGAPRWHRVYDSGPERLRPRRQGPFVQERLQDAIQRRFHEQAARLMRDAAGELRRWLVQERRRDRLL